MLTAFDMTSHEIIESINPATEEVLKRFEPDTREQVEQALGRAIAAFPAWRKRSFPERAQLMRQAASRLRQEKPRLAGIITTEMGKPLGEAEAEIGKCAWGCEYYAEHPRIRKHPDGLDRSRRELIRRPSATSEGDAAMIRSHEETKNYVDSEYRRIFEPFQILSSSTILSIFVLI
jgi:acyl-CoA reductase-like NAD-dependent aldehyde dehydrogenase